jgi:hypothetical protein
MSHHPDDGGSKHLWNVGELLPDTRRNNLEDSHLKAQEVRNFKRRLCKVACVTVRVLFVQFDVLQNIHS